MDIVTGTAGNTISSVLIVPFIQQIIQQIDNLIRLDDNRQLLEAQLNRMKSLLLDITSRFQDQQKAVPDSLRRCLVRMQHSVGKGTQLIHRSHRSQQCFDRLFCKRAREIREWKESFNELFVELETDFSLFCSAQQIVSAAPQQTDVLLQDEPHTGVVGLENKFAEINLERWLTEAPQVRIIGVYGMGGVGKTTLLKKVYNTYKVSQFFDDVIWVTVSQFSILELQSRIAYAINLDLANCPNDVDMRKMKLSAYLRTKKFLMVLDDMWRILNLGELGVEFNNPKGSKILFSTRNRNLIREMRAEESIKIQPLSKEEGWELFCKVCFKEGHVQVDLKHFAREVADECQGLPLAINVIASTMFGNIDRNEWRLALNHMKTVDPNFPIIHPRIDQDLYQRLKWSYDSLRHDHLKICFLLCAIYPEDFALQSDYLVQMWIAEGLVKSKDAEYLLDTGYSYVKLLHDRGLLQFYAPGWNKIHDVIQDMAIYIGENEENCVFRAGKMLQNFPHIPDDCRRISICHNNITSLPTLRCSNLVTLILQANENLEKIPADFFFNLPSLRVLDICETGIKSLPVSLWQLTKLEFLTLSATEIEHVPEGIGNLSHLQFLRMGYCRRLKSLPSRIGELKNLRYVSLVDCDNLQLIPKEITMLSNCKIDPDWILEGLLQ